jgi:hypothetical protein
MHLRSIFARTVWALVASSQILALAIAAERDQTAKTSGIRESFQFDPGDGLIAIPVHIGAADHSFVVDTGFTLSVFDASLQPELGPQVDVVKVHSPGGVVHIGRYSARGARIGSLPFAETAVLCRDLTALREASGYSWRGIVGMDFLREWIVRIDFDESRLQFLAPDSPRTADWGEPMPIVYDERGIPRLLADVGKVAQIPFQIDTGDRYTGSLAKWLFSKLVSSGEARITGSDRSMTVAGDCSQPAGRLSHLSLGSFHHANLRMSSAADNVLGLDFFRRYRVTIDFPNKKIYLAKGKRFADCMTKQCRPP